MSTRCTLATNTVAPLLAEEVIHMVKKQHQIIVLNKLRIKETLIHPEIIYQSPIFFWDGSLTSLDTIFDVYQIHFSHYYSWSAIVTPV